MSRLRKAAKSLISKHVRVLTSFTTNAHRRFEVNEIAVVEQVWRRGAHVKSSDGRYARHVPISYFELAE